MSGPFIIELRANEFARRRDRPHLPLRPEEIVADAVAAAAAGASILHWHARDPATGRSSNDPELFAAVCRGVRGETDMLLHPTLGYVNEQDPVARAAHVVALNEDPASRVDLVPVDFGSSNADLWDQAACRFRTEDMVYLNPRRNLRRLLEVLRPLGVSVVSVCWSVGQIRTARCFQDMGVLGWTLWELVFTGDTMPEGMAPTLRGLEAMVEQVPEGQPWSVLCVDGDALQLASWALELGGHVSIGLGDWPYRRFGSPRNADIVAYVARMAEERGRRPATTAEARELLRVGAS